MSPSSSIAIVLCCGSFHMPEHYALLVGALEAQGFEISNPALPTMEVSAASPYDLTHLDSRPPPAGWPNGFTDAEVIKAEIRTLVNAGRTVLLIGHSYGGWVATESAAPELRLRNRAAKGQTGGIVGIFFISGYVLPAGQSIHTFFSPQGDDSPLPPFVKLHGDGKKGLVMPYDAEQYFFHDLPLDEAKGWAKLLRAQPVIRSDLSHASYIDLPCAYLLCKQDKVFPLMVQEAMVKMSTEQGGNMSTYDCDASHSPFLSCPQDTANAVADFVSKLQGLQ